MEMTIGSRSLKGVASLVGLAAIVCAGLASCSKMVPTLPQGAGDPDLMVTAPAVSAGGPEAGAQFMLSATVSNDGEGAAAATMLRYYRLRYYRSTDATITPTDTEVGTDAIAGARCFGEQQPVGGSDGAVEPWDALLRSCAWMR